MPNHQYNPVTRTWSRTPELYQTIRQDKINKNAALAKAKPTTSEKLDNGINRSIWVIADMAQVESYVRRIVDRLPVQDSWQFINSYDLVIDFLSEDRSQRHQSVNPTHLFLTAGYNEPPNRYIAPLLRYTVSERGKAKRHTWLFTPIPPEMMSNIWGPETTPAMHEVLTHLVNLLTVNSSKSTTIPWRSAGEK